MDLLGVRRLYTREHVEMNWEQTWEAIFPSLTRCPTDTAIICEVKSGHNPQPIKLLTDNGRIDYAIQRLGLPESEIEACYGDLISGTNYSRGTIQIVKLVVTDWSVPKEWRTKAYFVSLEHIAEQMINHFSKWDTVKGPSWHYFPSDLIQCLIWMSQESRKNRVKQWFSR